MYSQQTLAKEIVKEAVAVKRTSAIPPKPDTTNDGSMKIANESSDFERANNEDAASETRAKKDGSSSDDTLKTDDDMRSQDEDDG